MEPTVGCVTRMSFIELPYIKCFLDHYFSIGINKIYIVNTSIDKEEEIKNYLSSYENKIYVENIESGTPINISQNQMLNKIQEKYTLMVDIDEFLNINPPNKIQNIINPNFGYYKFKWIMCPNDTNEPLVHDVVGFAGHIHKSMTLTQNIKFIKEHDMVLKTKLNKKGKKRKHKKKHKRKQKKKIFLATNLIHYWSRTFSDILLKCYYGKLEDGKQSSPKSILKNINEHTPPLRLRLLALLSKHEADISIEYYHLENIDFDMEKSIINDIDKDIIIKLHEIYNKYKEVLDESYCLMYPKNSLVELATILPD